MSKKDFELIARALYGCLIQSGSIEHQTSAAAQHAICCDRIALALAGTNPRFDRERFLAACGVKS